MDKAKTISGVVGTMGAAAGVVEKVGNNTDKIANGAKKSRGCRSKAKEYQRFEDIEHIRDDGSEFLLAREFAPALEYNKLGKFS